MLETVVAKITEGEVTVRGPVQPGIAFPPGQIEHHCRGAGPVDDLRLHFLQPDLGGLGFQNLVGHSGAQERYLAAGRLARAGFGSGIAQSVGHGFEGGLRHWLGGCRSPCRSRRRLKGHQAGLLAPLFGRIGLRAPFGIRRCRINRAVGQRCDPPSGDGFAHGRLRDAAMRRIGAT